MTYSLSAFFERCNERPPVSDENTFLDRSASDDMEQSYAPLS